MTVAVDAYTGSPALTEDGELIGISSWGLGDCDPMEPTLLTSIPFYYDWIKEQCPECGGVDGMEYISNPHTLYTIIDAHPF